MDIDLHFPLINILRILLTHVYWGFRLVKVSALCILQKKKSISSVRTWPAQGLKNLGLGLRSPPQKNIYPLQKKGPISL